MCGGVVSSTYAMTVAMTHVNPHIPNLDQIPIRERLSLLEVIWDSIVTSVDHLPPSSEHQHIIDQRLAEHAAAPDDVVPWDDLKSELLSEL